jgi:hypothetical protein
MRSRDMYSNDASNVEPQNAIRNRVCKFVPLNYASVASQHISYTLYTQWARGAAANNE